MTGRALTNREEAALGTGTTWGDSAMKCDASNGYTGWRVIDQRSGQLIECVEWVDPEDKTYCTVDVPFVLVGGQVACTVHRASAITMEFMTMTFWITRLASGIVAPLSRGRQAEEERTDKPCAECRQPETCRRIDYCAAHRCAFGEKAP